MPKLTFPISPSGLSADALIGLRGGTLAALYAAGQPIPAPIRGRGLIDTGNDITGISSSVVQRLGLVPVAQGSTQTVAGPLRIDLYRVSLSLTDFTAAGAPLWAHSDLIVMELVTTLPNIDVLIGMDMVLGCRMLVDGPARHFTLDF